MGHFARECRSARNGSFAFTQKVLVITAGGPCLQDQDLRTMGGEGSQRGEKEVGAVTETGAVKVSDDETASCVGHIVILPFKCWPVCIIYMHE